MPPGLQTYTVHVAIIGEPAEVFRQAADDTADELKMRPHLIDPEVRWDDERKVVSIRTRTEAPDQRSANQMVAEEVEEIVPAVVETFTRYRVEVIPESA